MQKLPDYGSLNIDNFGSFLKDSKTEFNKLRETKIAASGNLSDFNVIRLIGQGAYGEVFLVQHNRTGIYHAMKAITKSQSVRKYEVENIQNEAILLHCLNFPFIIRMEYCFTDNSCVHFVMPLITRGNMLVILREKRRFDENLVRFYGSQVVLGLEYLHYLNVVYRDLKPENLLIDHTGYLKITDFGSAKVIKNRTYTICGTPEYIAPEIILGEGGYSKSVDWWSLGILLYEMASGHVPFYHTDEMKMYEFAASLNYKMPNHLSFELKDLVKNILQTDLSMRFGNLKGGVNDIKEHTWFRPIIWCSLLNKTIKPPFIPEERNCIKCVDAVDLNHSNKNNYETHFPDF